MSRDVINPDNMYNSLQYGFSHAVVTERRKVIHCSGQVGWDANGELVGGSDVVLQARQALVNLREVLKQAGATPADVARIKVFVVGQKTEYLQTVGAEIAAFFGESKPAASTWLGVQALALPELLIEIEATAYLD